MAKQSKKVPPRGGKSRAATAAGSAGSSEDVIGRALGSGELWDRFTIDVLKLQRVSCDINRGTIRQRALTILSSLLGPELYGASWAGANKLSWYKLDAVSDVLSGVASEQSVVIPERVESFAVLLDVWAQLLVGVAECLLPSDQNMPERWPQVFARLHMVAALGVYNTMLWDAENAARGLTAGRRELLHIQSLNRCRCSVKAVLTGLSGPVDPKIYRDSHPASDKS